MSEASVAHVQQLLAQELAVWKHVVLNVQMASYQ